MNEYYQQIDNAQHYLEKLKLARDDREAFNRELRVFVSESRSVLQYAITETKKNGHNARLYAHLKQSKLFEFFRETRDITIHAKPLTPRQIVSVTMNASIRIGGFFEATLIRADGTIASTTTAGSRNPPPISTSEVESTCSHTFHFNHWEGEEDVETLCEHYLDEIRSVIEIGLREGWLTPERLGVAFE